MMGAGLKRDNRCDEIIVQCMLMIFCDAEKICKCREDLKVKYFLIIMNNSKVFTCIICNPLHFYFPTSISHRPFSETQG